MALAMTVGVNLAATPTDDPEKPPSLLLTIVVGVTISSWVQEDVVKMVRNSWFYIMRCIIYRIWKASSAPKPAKVVQQTGVVDPVELVQVQLEQPGNAKEEEVESEDAKEPNTSDLEQASEAKESIASSLELPSTSGKSASKPSSISQ